MKLFENIKLTLESTDIPDPEFIGCPVEANLSFDEKEITVHCIRTGTISADCEYIFKIKSDEIVNINVKYVDDQSDEMLDNPYYNDKIIFSELTIKHKDPFEVVEYFSTSFTSNKSYWIKAVVKMIQDSYKISPENNTNN